MFKKLDLLIIKAFIGPFIATFFITLFVLVLQFFWLYIDDVVGKGIDALTVGQLVFYLSLTLVPLALPLAVLLSSIMTLGNLGETFELIAIKAAGISLLRFMRPLFFVSLALTILAFFFNNNLLPIANLKMNTLKYDIIVTKPAFDIKEGVFYDRIEGFVIKIGKKEKDDSTIRNVVIYEQTGGQTDNVIIADSGKMLVTPDKQSLEFVLKSGTRYQEQGNGTPGGSQLTRMSFKQYKKVMDLSSFRMNKTDDSTFKHNYQMFSLGQLTKAIDSIEKINAGYVAKAGKDINLYMKFAAMLDTTGWQAVEKDTSRSKYLMSVGWATDSLRKAWTTAHHRRDSVDKAWAALKKTRDSIDQARAKTLAAQAAAAQAAAQASAKKIPPPGGASGPSSAGTPGSPTAGSPSSAGTPGSSPGSPATAGSGHPTGPASGATAQQAIAAANSPAAATPAANSPAPRPDIPGGAAMNRLADEKEPPAVTLADLIPDSLQSTVLNQSMTALNSAKVGLDQPLLLYKNEDNNLLKHEIAWHEKITLAVAVMVMFLIGAPLGSIIRKGGIGLPLVFAVVFFVIFFLLNNFGKKFVSQSVLTPVGGMWMATYVLTPIGLFLTYKAMNDSQLFNKEFYFRISRGVRALIQKWRSRKKPAAV
jgi:lipopolysaccharide export system permease protein